MHFEHGKKDKSSLKLVSIRNIHEPPEGAMKAISSVYIFLLRWFTETYHTPGISSTRKKQQTI
jgi:hypothetical protein